MKILIPILIIVMIAAVIFWLKQSRSETQTVLNEHTLDDFPPVPKWKPDIPVDINRIVRTLRYYAGPQACFAVFKNGTCVRVDPTSTTPQEDALAQLDAIFHQHPDFNPLLMDDGDWMVSHSDIAYSICFADEIDKNWEAIDANHLDALARAEVLLNSEQQPNVFDKRGKIGLFGRARWFMDCQNPIVIRIEKPESQPAS